MKKALHRFTALALIVVLLAGLCLQAFAAWPATGNTSSDYYLTPGILKIAGKQMTEKATGVGGFIRLYMVPEGSQLSAYTMTPTSIDFGDHLAQKDNTTDLKLNQAYDFSKPVQYNITAKDGRTAPVFALAVEGSGAWTDAEKQEYLGMAELFADGLHTICQAINKIESSEVAVGSYHPANAKMLYQVAYWVSRSTANYDDPSAGMGGNLLFESYESKWQAGGSEAVTFMREYLEKYLAQNSDSSYFMKPSAMKTVYKQIIPLYLDYALNTRIADPVITKVSIDGSVGEIDAEKSTVTVYLPAGTNLSNLSIDITAADGCKVRSTAGSIASKNLAYAVTPYDKAYGTEYTALQKTWRVQIKEGTPRNEVTSFGITVGGKTRYAAIDQEKHTITLNLPDGTPLTELKPIIEHTGTRTSMDGKTLDFTSEQTLTLTNSKFNLTTDYTVTVTANKSDENRILSYKIGDAVGTITGDNISITVPYAEDLTKAKADIEYSEFAKIAEPSTLKEGTNSYTITSESGKIHKYTVTITRAAVATGKQILSFRYGSAEAVIDQARGTITLELPAGSPSSFAPIIAVSPYATVTPASG